MICKATLGTRVLYPCNCLQALLLQGVREKGLEKGPWPGCESHWAHGAWGGQFSCVPIAFVLYPAHSLEITQSSKEENEPNPSTRSYFSLLPCSCVNERVWGVFYHQAESHLTHCSQLVPSHLWLDTGGMPDLAEAVLEGSVLLQSISDLSNLTGLRLFPSLHSEKSEGFPFLHPSCVWKAVVSVDHTEGEGCSRHSHLLCPCPSPVLFICRLWLGCAPCYCPWAGRHRRQLSSADKMLPTTQSEQF